MDVYSIYKAIKAQISPIAPVFFYVGQYTKGKENTSYLVPAIYIELPKGVPTTFFRKIETARRAPVRIHLISNAPYKNHDSAVQDGAIADHNRMFEEIDRLLTGWAAKDGQQRLLTQQLIPTAANMLNFQGLHVFSVKTYTADLFSYHLYSS